ncbi:MAG: glycosyltransferase family 2 protein [Alphaproteobacteria bacterium]|nr:glycosyltransferase family 2 protein [Alphaproteobacteria bacterium]
MPKVSVLMTVRDGETWLSEAVRSILDQTLEDFEFIIVDDASNDSTPEVLAKFVDCRLRVVRNNERQGRAASLNRGLTLCRAQYIARIDADDIATPERLEQQAAFLDRHPETGIVGGGALYFDAHGNIKREVHKPSDPLRLEWTALWSPPFVHSTEMFRKDLADGFDLEYDPALDDACDLDYWYRARRITRASNLEAILVRRRWHHEALQIRFAREEQSVRNAIHLKNMNEFMGCAFFEPEDICAIRQVMSSSADRACGVELRSIRKFKCMLDCYCHRRRKTPGLRHFYISELKSLSRQITRHLGPVAIVPVLCSFERRAA